jgi:hypothetical protein
VLIDKVVALLDNLNSEELDKLPPARRRKFSELCYHWHRLAEVRLKGQPKAGILADLKDGKRSE